MIARKVRSTSEVKTAYDENSRQYDTVRFGTPGGRYVDAVEREFVANLVKSSAVLEVGTATGRFAVLLTGQGAEYLGVDVSFKMLKTTSDRTDHCASVVQMDGSNLGLIHHFDYALCVRTFHFLTKPVEALKGMFMALRPSGACLVTFETDNAFRRFLIFFRIGVSEQYYYKISDVEEMFLKAGFKSVKAGSVMRLPVTLYRTCPRVLLPMLKRLETQWPWAMHDYVLGFK